MELLASILVFLLVSTANFLLAWKYWVQPRAVMERVAGVPSTVRLPAHPALFIRELTARLGSLLPHDPKSSSRLAQLLVRAGFSQSRAVPIFLGARVVSALFLGALAAAVAWNREISRSDVFMTGLFGALLGSVLPGLFVSWKVRRRQKQIRRGLPDTLDLLVICVESGLGLDQAIAQTARELERVHPDISRELAIVHLELKTGTRRQEALRNLARRTGVSDLQKLVSVLIQADRFGTSIAQALRTQSEFMRTRAYQLAEEKAAKLGVKLTFPIFFCILPALFAITVGPVVVRMMRELVPLLKGM